MSSMTTDQRSVWRDQFVEHYTNKQHRLLAAWLHTALAKETSGRTSHASRAIVPLTLINTVKTFEKLFRVNDRGMFERSPSRFNRDLFRSLSYPEFKKLAGFLEVGQPRTFRRNIAKLVKIGVLERIKNRQDDSGRWGIWYVRLNPFKIGYWVEATFSKTKTSELPEASTPEATDGRLFSLMGRSLSAVATPQQIIADSQSVPRSKKKVLEPGGSKPISKKTESIIRRNILATETGRVVEILTAVYPELPGAPIKLLKRIHGHVEAWQESRRLTPSKARALVQMHEQETESLEGFARLKTFAEVLPFWPKINQVLRKWMLADFDTECSHAKARFEGVAELLSDPTDVPSPYMAPAQAKLLAQTRELMRGLQRGDDFDSLHKLAATFRDAYIDVPLTYAEIVKTYKFARHIIGLPPRVHNQVCLADRLYREKVEAWDAVKWRYGF